MGFLELRTLFLFVYFLLVIWSLFKWVDLRTFRETSLRSRIGSVGLIGGSTSASLLASFYSYVWIVRQLPAHGLALWILLVVGASLAIGSLILASVGTGWVRRSGFVISLVAAFQWGRPSIGRGPIGSVDLAMFASLALSGLVLLVHRYLRAGRAAL